MWQHHTGLELQVLALAACPCAPPWRCAQLASRILVLLPLFNLVAALSFLRAAALCNRGAGGDAGRQLLHMRLRPGAAARRCQIVAGDQRVKLQGVGQAADGAPRIGCVAPAATGGGSGRWEPDQSVMWRGGMMLLLLLLLLLLPPRQSHKALPSERWQVPRRTRRK